MKKILLSVLALIILGIGSFLIFFNLTYPKVSPAPDIKVDMSEANIKRGEYLANNVAACIDCHSSRDWSKFSGPPVIGTEGKGGEKFGEEMGLPGNFYSANISPSKLKDWTDGEIYRAITAGVSKDGRALFPIMPYPNFAKMAKEDIFAIIAYIRTLKEQDNEVPASEASFPMSLIMKSIPQDASHSPIPDKSNTVAYGKYLVTAASCSDCHTQVDKGTPLPGMDFAGGREFKTPMGLIISANITPDLETGIGKWTKEQFIAKFKQYNLSTNQAPVVAKGSANTIMPWAMYGGMTDEDIAAMYDYLRTLKAVKNKVTTFKAIAEK